MSPWIRILPVLLAAGLSACGDPAVSNQSETANASGTPVAANPLGNVCTIAAVGIALPIEVRETSGLALGRRNSDRVWTHNDRGGRPELFALDAEGRLLQTVRVAGVDAIDWEDIEAGSCSTGACLFIADIGDNDANRATIAVHEVPEPDGEATTVEVTRTRLARFPDGPRDAESLLRTPDGQLFVVTKGRDGPITVFRFPQDTVGTEPVTLEFVREILPRPTNENDLVSAATATQDGRWIGVRTYRSLFLYPAEAFVTEAPVEPFRVDIGSLREVQGEGLAIGDEGSIWLSSEAGSRQLVPTLSRMSCALGDLGGQSP